MKILEKIVFSLALGALMSCDTANELDNSKDEGAVVVREVPHIYVYTENSVEITSKEDYMQADMMIDGFGNYPNYTGSTRIRGRGNSTWGRPKKPYRLKLDKKSEILNLPAEKDWVLLANDYDPTMMMNAVAMQIAHLLNMPYTNHAVPVNLTINDTYRGSYMLTEQVEISETRVNVDEKQGVLLELDSYFDEDWKFRSSHYDLPVMVKDPDVKNDAHFATIQSDFQTMEDLLAAATFPNNGYDELIDIESVVGFLITYNLTQNVEINHPKSTYMHKDVNGKYTMGPVWDFDWGFDYNDDTKTHFDNAEGALLRPYGERGTRFFSRFLEDPAVRDLYKRKWNQFRQEGMHKLLVYMADYYSFAGRSFKSDNELWTDKKDYAIEYARMKAWLNARAEYIDRYVAEL